MSAIPQVFHRLWLGSADMPIEFEDFGATWCTLHPSWRMITWRDRDLPALKNQWAMSVAPTMAARSNIARYEIVLQHGGVYVDNDFACLRNIEPLLDGVECFVGWASEHEANNAIIGARPGHPFLYDLVVSLEESVRQFSQADATIVQSGPHYLTKVLGRHPEVTVFPPEVFYPYAWHERWRRSERFRNAYAVHHWALTWRASKWPEQRVLGNGATPSLSVIVQPADGQRLRWILEGLKVQTVKDFEVIVITASAADAIADAVAECRERLDIRYEFSPRGAGKAGEVARYNAAVGLARAPRVLFLAGDCLPDTDVVETHASVSAHGVVPFGFARRYPATKFYEYYDPLDYDGLAWHTTDDPQLSMPMHGDWRDVAGCSLSASSRALEQTRGLRRSELAPVPGLARELARRFFRLRPLWDRGYVTRLE